MASSVETYLQQMEQKFKNINTHSKAKSLNNGILQQIDRSIYQNQIFIPNNKTPLKTVHHDKKENNVPAQAIQAKRKQIQEKKKIILQQLQSVQLMQSQIKMNRSMHTALGKQSRVKSVFTKQQAEKIKAIRKQQKKFQRKLKKKEQKYEENLKNWKESKQKQEELKIKQKGQQKNQERQKHIEEIQTRNKLRQKELQIQSQKIKKIKQEKKLFQKMEEKWLKVQKQKVKIREVKLQEHKKQRQISFDDVKSHQSEYDQKHRSLQQERLNRINNFKNPIQVKYQCLFLDSIKQEHQRAIYQDEEKKQMIRTFAQKKAAYAEHVRKILQKNMKTMSESTFKKMEQEKLQPKWLNTPQKYLKGTQYMRQVHNQISKLKRKPLEKQQQNIPRYKNYLVDLKQANITKNGMDKSLVQTRKLGAKEDITSKNLVQSVKAKINCLKQMQQNY